ncbi:MAG TPA: hypothetical protein VK658_14815 [Chryseolinea sp.]|nr:hypothetical protein [Chryseolinea sp.]
MAYLQNISRFSANDNIGGIITLRVIRKDDVETFPEPSNGIVYGDIVPKAGRAFVVWSAILESSSTKSATKATREGASKQNTLPFLLPKDRAAIKPQLDLAAEDEFIVLFTDANGTNKIFGSLETPVRFEYDHDSGKSFENLNAYDCRFYYPDGPDNFFHYNGSLSAPPVGTAPAVVKYNGVAIASLAPGEVFNIISEFGFTNFYTSSS